MKEHTQYSSTLALVISLALATLSIESMEYAAKTNNSHPSHHALLPCIYSNLSTTPYVALGLTLPFKSYQLTRQKIPYINITSQVALALNLSVMASRMISHRHDFREAMAGSALGLGIGQLIAYISMIFSPESVDFEHFSTLRGSDILFFHCMVFSLSMPDPEHRALSTLLPLFVMVFIAKAWAYTYLKDIAFTHLDESTPLEASQTSSLNSIRLTEEGTVSEHLIPRPPARQSVAEGLVLKTPLALFCPDLRKSQTYWGYAMQFYLWGILLAAIISNISRISLDQDIVNINTSEKTEYIAQLLTWILTGISVACGFALSLTVDILGHEDHLLPRP